MSVNGRRALAVFLGGMVSLPVYLFAMAADGNRMMVLPAAASAKAIDTLIFLRLFRAIGPAANP